MKSIFLALTFVVFAYAQVITFANEFAPTYEGQTATSLIKVKNNGKFFKNGKNTINSIKFRISVESVKPKSAVAVFNPVDEKFFGAITGEAEGFFYFKVNGLNGTYQCQLHMKYTDWKGNVVKVAPYSFAFTIQKKKSRDAIGRVRPNEEEIEVPLIEEGTMIVTESTTQEESGLQARQSGPNPDCPTPSSNDIYWAGCNLQSILPQSTANNIVYKNLLASTTPGTNPYNYNVMANITYSFSSVSLSTSLLITGAPTTVYRGGSGTINLNITSSGSCNTYFTLTVNYKKASGTNPTNLVFQPGSTVYSWTTTFNPVFTYAAPGASC